MKIMNSCVCSQDFVSIDSSLCNIVKVEKISASNKSVDRAYTLDITCKVIVSLLIT